MMTILDSCGRPVLSVCAYECWTVARRLATARRERMFIRDPSDGSRRPVDPE